MEDVRGSRVHIEETNLPSRTIQAVDTTTVGFVGEAETGPTAPTLVTSWAEFVRTYGGFLDRPPFNRPRCHLPYAVRGFFENGGRRAIVARVTSQTSGPQGRIGAADARLEDYAGDAAAGPATGIAALAAIKDVAILAAPDDVVVDGLARVLVESCERLRDRFAVTSVAHASHDASLIRTAADSSWGATYYPWLRVPADHTPEGSRLIPPAGHVCGIYARVDEARGVHKAPANEPVKGIVTETTGRLSHDVTRAEQEILNPRGVNVIRDFGRRGVLVWGARTMASDSEWKYVNVRRLCIFLEQSIERGIQWAVFEPNTEPTWLAVRRAVDDFLTRVWRDGALAGNRPDHAFFVKCDRSTMTQDDIENGRLICQVGVAPISPAEFVIFRVRVQLDPDGRP